MAILDNIEIRIKSNGRFLDEYNEPDESTTHDLDTTTKYIEATPGAKFSIEVLVRAGYLFHGGDCLIVDRRMDGSDCQGRVMVNEAAVDCVRQPWEESLCDDLHF